MTARRFTFAAGTRGPWRIVSTIRVSGDALADADRLDVVAGVEAAAGAAWALTGTTSNERYVRRDEKTLLVERQEALDRPQATSAALIPIRKTAAWWALAQDERREIFEAQSRHIAIGLRYLPAIARRLHHCRDLGRDEAFDFLTWFEYAPDDGPAFDEMLVALRGSPEWTFVEREVDVRLVRDGAG